MSSKQGNQGKGQQQQPAKKPEEKGQAQQQQKPQGKAPQKK